jgi:hypothetical protein
MDIQNRYFIKEKDFVTREITGETIIVPIKGNVGDLDSIYTLNEVGTVIWGLIDGKKSLDQIIEAIYSAYEVTPEEATKDMVDFVSSLEEAGLIRSIGVK